MTLIDRRFGTSFFNAADGGDPERYRHSFRVFAHADICIMILSFIVWAHNMFTPDMPLRHTDSPAQFAGWNIVSMIGVFGFGLAQLNFLRAVGLPRRKGSRETERRCGKPGMDRAEPSVFLGLRSAACRKVTALSIASDKAAA